MAEAIHLPDLTDDEDRTLNGLLDQLEAKRRRNRIRAAYYDMHHAIRLVGSVIPPQYFKLAIVLGWTGKAVDSLSRRCNLDGFVWPDGDLDELGFREVWERNNLGSEVSQGTISSLIHATSFAVNTLGDESEGEPKGLIHFKSALEATGTWNGRARRLDNLLSITSRDKDGKPTGLALYLDGVTIVGVKSGGSWSTDRQKHAWGVPAEPLVYKPRLGRAFGSSRISRAAMALQDQATRALIRLEAHSDIYAIPDLWMFGADESIFKNADGSLKASWQIMMGRIKGIPDDDEAASDALARADVKQFPAASPSPHLEALNTYAKMFAREMSLPDTAVAITDIANPTSAESYDASQYELIAEAEGATDDWRPGLRRTLIRALAMQNDTAADDIPPEWATIDTKWRSPRYLSRAAEADAGVKQLAAVQWLADTEVGLELLGMDDQQIARAVAERRRAQGSAALQAILRSSAEQVTGGAASGTA